MTDDDECEQGYDNGRATPDEVIVAAVCGLGGIAAGLPAGVV